MVDYTVTMKHSEFQLALSEAKAKDYKQGQEALVYELIKLVELPDMPIPSHWMDMSPKLVETILAMREHNVLQISTKEHDQRTKR